MLSSPPDTLPPLREVIERDGLKPKKSLGQHFLLDPNLLDRIARAAGNLQDQLVIEVGPGPGGLTRALLARDAKKIVVIEQDSRCILSLEELKQIYRDRLEIVETDALTINEQNFIKADQPAKIVANLPYNIATELLFKWLNNLQLFESLTLMFQKEVADRIMAEPGNKVYGRLSVMAQWACEVHHNFDIDAKAFLPPPKVTSSVITLVPRIAPIAAAKKETLEKICKAAFGQRRKMLRSSLKQITNDPEHLLKDAGIDPVLRPEVLDISQFCALARALEQ